MFLSNSTSKQSLTRPAPGRAFNQNRHNSLTGLRETTTGLAHQQA
jgi:hypothetical protein